MHGSSDEDKLYTLERLVELEEARLWENMFIFIKNVFHRGRMLHGEFFEEEVITQGI